MEKITEVVFGDSLCHEIKISKFSKNNKLFILLKDVDKERYNLLKEIIYNNLGEVPLNFAIQIGEHKEVKKSRLSVDINSRFISRIEKLLGENSVIINGAEKFKLSHYGDDLMISFGAISGSSIVSGKADILVSFGAGKLAKLNKYGDYEIKYGELSYKGGDELGYELSENEISLSGASTQESFEMV